MYVDIKLSLFFIILFILWALEDLFEFLEWNLTVAIFVMLFKDFVKFILGDRMAKFVHGGDDIFFGDYTGVVGIELVEGSFQLLIIHELLDIKSSD